MKIQLDTSNKTITIEKSIKLETFMKAIEDLLPKGKWKEFTLQITPIINWNTNPIVINNYPSTGYPWNTPIYYSDPIINITPGTTQNNNIYSIDLGYLKND